MSAILSVTPKILISGDDAATDSRTEQWRRGDTYQVLTTDAGLTQGQILIDPRIPQLRSPHPDGLYVRVSNRNARRISPIMWEVDVQYETPQNAGGGGANNPLLAAPIIEFSSEVTEEEVDQDVDGNALIFKTGEEPDPKLREETHTPLVNVRRNVLWVNPAMIADYRNKYNNDWWFGNPPGTCLIRSLRASSVEDVDFTYWTVDASIAIRYGVHTSNAKAWWRRLRAQGYLVNIEDPDLGVLTGWHAMKRGQPVTRPVLHDPDTGFEITNNADAKYYEWDTKGGRPFFNLGLL